MEMDEMEGLRIQSELDKLRGSWSSLIDVSNNPSSHTGVVSSLIDYPTNKRDRPLSRTLSNSLLDMTLAMNASSTCKLNNLERRKKHLYDFSFFFFVTLDNHHTTMNNTSELLPSRNSQCSVDSGMVIKILLKFYILIVIIFYSQPKSVHSR